MSISHLKKQIARITDMAIDNIDKHFIEYISIDLQETGDDDYFLVDSVNYSLHWMSILGELKPTMDELKSELIAGNESQELFDLWIESVALKTLIDGKIIKYELAAKQEEIVDQYEVFGFIGLDIKPPKKPEPISFIINENGIKELHQGIKRRFGYIDATFEDFIKHTQPSDEPYERIRWKTADLDLVMFVLLLLKHGKIPLRYSRPKYQVEFIYLHFMNEYNKPFKPNSIATQLRSMKKHMDSILYKELDVFIAQL